MSDKRPFSIQFDTEKENGVTVFTITQFMDTYDAMGETVRKLIQPQAQSLYLGIQALWNLSEINEARTADLLNLLRALDTAIQDVGRNLASLLDDLKRKHHVEKPEGGGDEEKDLWADLIEQ